MPSSDVGGALQHQVRSPSELNLEREADLPREERRAEDRVRSRLELAGMISMTATILGGLGLVGGLLFVRAETRESPRRTAALHRMSCAGAPVGIIIAVRERINCG